MKQAWLRLAVSVVATINFLERAESATQKIGDLTWNYEIVNGFAVIKPVGFGGGGSFTPAVSPCSGSLEIPSTLGGKPVREIDEYAFYCQYWLTSVYIPDSVRKIGACAFAMLGNNDSKLKVVSGGDGIEEIERDAFANCRCLESINIGDKLVKITGAFTDCVSLGDGWVVVNGWVLIYNGAFTSSVVIPEGVIGLSGALFRESKVKKVQLPSTLKYLGELTFYGSALESIAIPDGVLEIPYCAFEGCKSLQSIVIPKSVTNVDDTAFDYCSQLKLVYVDTGDIARISSLCKFGADVKIIECITMDDISVPYPVSALPTPTIRDNVKNKVLTLGTDYTIDSTNSSVPSGVGVGKIAIVMKGAYEGEYVFSYSVTKKDISRAVITLGDALTYDGKKQTQSITSVEVDALPVTFSVSGNTGTNAGEYTLTVTGSGNFAGKATKKWSISNKSIEGAEIVFGDELVFDGTWQEQSIANVIIDDLSATFSASNHVHRNSGTYELVVAGTGNFCGSAKKKFTIGRRDISSATISLGGSLTYNGKEQAQLVEAVTVDGLNATFDVSANLATDAGEYELTVNGTGNFTGSAKSKFTVSRRGIADAVVTLGDALTYNGQEQSQPVAGVKVDRLDVTYTVSGNKATAAGEHELTIHGTGNFTGTAVRKFVVGRKDIADAEIVLGSPLTYNGKEQTQTVQGVTVDGLDASYTVSGNKATVAGNHTLTIIGAGNFTGSATKSFTVARKDISDAAVVLGAALVYNGKEQAQLVDAVTVDGLNATFDVSANLATDAGEYELTVNGTGNFTGLVKSKFIVSRKDIADAVVTLGDALTYNGQEQSQSVAGIKVDGLDVTYTVSGNKATAAGEHELTIHGTGNFTGTAVRKFVVGRKDIADAEIVLGTPLTYNGKEQTQTVQGVTVDGLDASYTVSGNKATVAGNHTLTIIGTGNFTGSATKSFTVARKDISDAGIVLGAALVYNGKEQAQLVDAVTVDGLNATFDVSANLATDAGEYELTVNGTGNFTGVAKGKFTVSRKDIADAVVTLGDALTYNGQEQSQSVIGVKVDGIDVTYTVSGNKATTAGEHELFVQGTGNFCGEKRVLFSVACKDIAKGVADKSIVLSTESIVYDGKSHTAPVSLNSVGGETVTFTVSSVAGETFVDAGKYPVSLIGTGNFCGTLNVQFQIDPRDISGASVLLGSELVYNGKNQTMKIESARVGDLEVTYDVSGNTAKDAGDHILKLTGTGNFTGCVEVNYSIEKKDISDATIDLAEELTYNGSQQTQGVVVRCDDLTATVDVENNVALEAGEYILTVRGTGNFKGCAQRAFTVKPKQVSSLDVGLEYVRCQLDGMAKTPKVSVTDPSLGELTESDYSVAYANNTEAGLATVKITGKGNYGGEVSRTFEIVNAVTSVTGVQRLPWNELIDVDYEVVGSIDESDEPVGVVAEFGENVVTQFISKGELSVAGAAGTHHALLDLRSVIEKDSQVWISVFIGEFPSAPKKVSVRKVGYYTQSDLETLAVKYSPLFEDEGEVAQVIVDGEIWKEGDSACEANWSSEDAGVHELRHRVLKGGVAIGDDYVITCEVWTATVEVESTDKPLQELLPKTYDKVSTVVLADSVKSIPDGFFDGCSALSDVVLPAELEDLGYDALPDLIKTQLSFDGNGLMIWKGWVLDCRDRKVTKVSIPEGVVGVGRYALSDMEDLEEIGFPSTIRYFAKGAFCNDTYLDKLVIPDSIEIIGESAFADCSWMQTLTFGAGLRSIGRHAFDGCTKLARAVLADGVENVDDCAFNGCWRLLSVSLPLSVTNVASTAFTGCSSLTGVTVPTSIAPMSDWFAPVYKQVKDVTVPSGEENVCPNMFYGCTALQSVLLANGITNISDGAFRDCTSLASITLPLSLRNLGENAFRNCDSLSAVGVPDSVERIGGYAFYDCYQLSDVSLGKALGEISERAFDACPHLDSITIPAAVTNLGARICGGSLRAIYYLGSAPSYDDDVYAGSSYSLTSYVKDGAKGWDGRPTSRDIPTEWPVGNQYARAITTWLPVQYDVTFDAGLGVFYPVESHTYSCEQIVDTAYSLPPFDPTRTGYKFAGWWTEAIGGTQVTPSTGVKLTKPHTLYAHWTESAVVRIRFNAMGGTVDPVESDYTAGVPFGTLPVPTREHYMFIGWYTAATGGTLMRVSTEAPSADRELFARWVPAHYLIRFNANNGTGETALQDYIYGETVTLRLNTFWCSGCQFVGWSLTPGGEVVYSDGKTLKQFAAIEDGVIDLYAAWSGNTYAVRFDSHGGLGVMPNQTFVVGVEQRLSKCQFVRSGFVFAGWARSTTADVAYEDCAAVSNLSQIPYSTVVLFAVWVRDPNLQWSIGEYLNCEEREFVNDDVSAWVGDKVISHDGEGSMRSGAIDGGESTLTTTVYGKGTLGFWWKVSSETYKTYQVDYISFRVDGEEVFWFGGDKDWEHKEYEITGDGEHVITWAYVKDESGSDGSDCAWLDELTWSGNDKPTDPIPEINENADEKEVQSALEGSTDARLAENITDAATYNAYREWALKIGAADVKASPFAWVSFATDSAALLAKMPTDEDLKVEEFKPSGTAGSFDFTVSVKDVTIGDKASVDNLKKFFGLEGAESLAPAAFSFENVELDFKEPQDGKLKFSATPAVDNAKSFFMKVKVK